LRCILDLSFENVEVRFLTLDERKSLEERLEDVFADWLVKRGY